MLSIPKECVLCGLPRVCLHMFDARADLICIGRSRGQPGLAVCDNDRDVRAGAWKEHAGAYTTVTSPLPDPNCNHHDGERRLSRADTYRADSCPSYCSAVLYMVSDDKGIDTSTIQTAPWGGLLYSSTTSETLKYCTVRKRTSKEYLLCGRDETLERKYKTYSKQKLRL